MAHHTSGWRLALAGVLVAAASAALVGCGGAGYEVLRSDARTEYPEGPMGFVVPSVTAGGEGMAGFSVEAFATAMQASLAEHAPHFELRVEGQGAEAPPFTIRVDSLARLEGETPRVRGRVVFVDTSGRVTSELQIDAAVSDLGEAGAREAGAHFGDRVAHYVETREHHHY